MSKKLINFFFNTKNGLFAGLTIFAATVLIIIVIISQTVPSSVKPIEEKAQAKLEDVYGIVELQRFQTSDWVIANNGDALNQGDSLRTSDNAEVNLHIDGGDAIRLNQSTEINLVSSLSNSVIIAQLKGETYSRVVKSEKGSLTLRATDIEIVSMQGAFGFNLNPGKTAAIYAYGNEIRVSYNTRTNIINSLDKLLIDLAQKQLLISGMTHSEYGSVFVQWNQKLDEDAGYKKPDTNLPKISIISPGENSTIGESKVNIKGFVSDDSGIAKVIINNLVYFNLNENQQGLNKETGEFNADVDLIVGENTITIKTVDIFLNESEEKKIKITRINTVTPSPTQVIADPDFHITTINSPESGKIYVKWVISDLSAPNGFRVVKSSANNPAYPGNEASAVLGNSVKDFTWSNLTPGTYNIRVCILETASKCGRYTNNRTIILAEPTPTVTPTVTPTPVIP